MLKVIVFKEEKVEEKTTFLRVKLVPRAFNNGVTLVAVDKAGRTLHCGNIVSLSEKGLYLHSCVDPEANLPVNAAGQVEVVDD